MSAEVGMGGYVGGEQKVCRAQRRCRDGRVKLSQARLRPVRASVHSTQYSEEPFKPLQPIGNLGSPPNLTHPPNAQQSPSTTKQSPQTPKQFPQKALPSSKAEWFSPSTTQHAPPTTKQ